jgi:superfamily II DNA/RNA helicase
MELGYNDVLYSRFPYCRSFMQTDTLDRPISFSALSLAPPLLGALNEMGLDFPTPVQQQAVPLALAHQDLCVSAATGSGKTAAFLYPCCTGHWPMLPRKRAYMRSFWRLPENCAARFTINAGNCRH